VLYPIVFYGPHLDLDDSPISMLRICSVIRVSGAIPLPHSVHISFRIRMHVSSIYLCLDTSL